jgi:hypothetical protein
MFPVVRVVPGRNQEGHTMLRDENDHGESYAHTRDYYDFIEASLRRLKRAETQAMNKIVAALEELREVTEREWQEPSGFTDAQDAQAKRNWRDALLNADTLIGEFTFEARDALQAALEE